MISIGSDPEVFAVDETGQTIPAYFAMDGDVDWQLPFGTAYPDGAAIEFTVTPSNSAEELSNRLYLNLIRIRNNLVEKGLRVSLESNTDVSDFIPLLPEEYGKRASLQILGCNEDIRVYDWVDEVKRPDPKAYPYRTIGTHIHLELGEELCSNWPFVQFLTCYLDAVVGTAGVYLLEGNESARLRNVLYGKSGTIRIKKKSSDGYDGVEYRPLSSHAVLHSKDSIYTFFSTAQQVTANVITLFEEQGYAGLLQGIGGIDGIKTVQQCLDTYNTEVCISIQKVISRNLEIDVVPLSGLYPTSIYV